MVAEGSLQPGASGSLPRTALKTAGVSTAGEAHYGDHYLCPDALWRQRNFLWKNFGQCSFRRADTGKWYGAILTASHAKLGLAGDGTAEILDLRAAPEDVARLTAGGKCICLAIL